ncbi:MAG: DUF3604 domain-containing protein [Onishia taeanensis]|uniref:DUF3604 domain-containing protein n=1 Tax=Onishia taeanensis TaxID=284577 RepID=UPI003C7B1974
MNKVSRFLLIALLFAATHQALAQDVFTYPNNEQSAEQQENADKSSQLEPFTIRKPLGFDNFVDLWKWREAYEEKTGGKVLAIAHNGNLSNDQMFPIV